MRKVERNLVPMAGPEILEDVSVLKILIIFYYKFRVYVL